MKKIFISMVVLLVGLLMTGCAGMQQKTHSHDSKVAGDTFVEASGEALPAGFGDLVIRTAIKTHPEGFYPMESASSHHGTDHYPFTVTVGAQSATWSVTGVQSDTPKYAPDGSTPNDPEAGPGMRYALDKRLRLKPGTYDMRLDLPDDNVTSIAKVTIQDGKSVIIEFKPVYRNKTFPVLMPSYRKGINSLEVYIDGKQQS